MRPSTLAVLLFLACSDPNAELMLSTSDTAESASRQAHELRQSVAEGHCLPPTPVEVARARDTLNDFTVIRGEPHQLYVSFPTEAELDDLAYFMAAVSEETTAPQMFDSSAYHSQTEAEFDPFLSETARSHASDSLMPYVEASAEPATSAANAEASGDTDDEDDQDERLDGATAQDEDPERFQPLVWRLFEEGHCATAAGLYWRVYEPMDERERFLRARIACEEKAHHCRGAVSARLASVGSHAADVDNVYGPQRLAAAGFDLARLYRGAFLTAFRDMMPSALQELFIQSPRSVRDAAMSRLTHQGPEAWEFQVRAIEGLSDLEQRQAVPRLMDLLRVWLLPKQYPSSDSPVVRSIQTLSALVSRPSVDPCLGDVTVPPEAPTELDNNGSRRSVLTLSKCGEVLDRPDREQLAAEVISQLKSSIASQAPAHTHFEFLVSALLADIDAEGSLPALREIQQSAADIAQRACDPFATEVPLDKGRPVSCPGAQHWNADLIETIEVIEDFERNQLQGQ
jgi:hypothetical protein